MPLKPGSDKETISENISEFHKGDTYAHTKSKFGAEKANKQAVAASYSEARRGKAKSAKGDGRKGRFAPVGKF